MVSSSGLTLHLNFQDKIPLEPARPEVDHTVGALDTWGPGQSGVEAERRRSEHSRINL